MKTIIVICVVLLFIALGIWILKDNPEKAVFKKLILFPQWFKYLGIVIFLVGAILPFELGLLYEGQNFLGLQIANMGLFLICFSKDKNEDEMINLIRLKSLYRSVIMGFLYSAIVFAIRVFSNNEGEHTPATQLVMFILLVYLFNFYITKSRIRK
jgi:predicted membrane channel-forming protein YqfA (hemolysin III family)